MKMFFIFSRRNQTFRTFIWRLCCVTVAILTIFNVLYFYSMDSKSGKLGYDSKSYAVIEEIIKQKVRIRNSNDTDRVLVMVYSELGLNISREIFRNHPHVWFWQPYSLKMVAKEHSEMELVKAQANTMTTHAFNCNMNSAQLTAVEATSPDFKCSSPGVSRSWTEKTYCINQLCKDRRMKVLVNRDLTLNEFFTAIQANKYQMKIVLILQVPIEIDDEDDIEYRHQCQHLVSDVQRAAELEGLYPGMRKLYFVEEFRRSWSKVKNELLSYLNLSRTSQPEPNWNQNLVKSEDSPEDMWKKIYRFCMKTNL